MAGFIRKIFKTLVITTVVSVSAFAVQQQNPRGGSARNSGRSVDVDTNASIRRSATAVIARSTSTNARKKRPVVTARSVPARSVSVRSVRPVITSAAKSRAASKQSLARSTAGTNVVKNGAKFSRAATARATAVFNDVSKIGGGYTSCRDAYATCMDQFCAVANDTYRRCFCSDRFQDFRDTSDRMDKALQMLAEFQDVNLDAVGKTAAEVNAMYTATAGEQAIKRDTSAAQKLLDSIGDMLSGKSSATTTKPKQSSGSLGILDFSTFATSNDDIFGSSSIFGGGTETNMADLEGKELYDSAAKQCSEITRESCGGDAMFNLARSAYSIMITQDCNAFEKNINAKKASIEETVRTAEKYLRDARLEEYRAHNSSDVNDCLTKVEEAMRQPTVCGEKYERCMDYTGQYINAVTGEPIYSQALFGLNKLIVLDGSADVLGANKNFNKWLDEKKIFAETALNSCRDWADTVWYEFKRAALIQIAQAQDEKIQQIKDACVTTIKECYDTQTNEMKKLDTEEESASAIGAVAARGICYEKVQACAALYGDPNGCQYDDSTKKMTAVEGKKCGLQALLAYVDTVDSVKVAEGCETALRKYAHELCDPPVGSGENMAYMGCAPGRISQSELRAKMNMRMKTFCAQDLILNDESNTISESSAFNTNVMNMIIKDIYDELGIAFTAGCEEDADYTGVWITANDVSKPNIDMLEQGFYRKYYGTSITNLSQLNEFNLAETGWCVRADGMARCEEIENAVYHQDSGECELPDSWYIDMCSGVLGGTWVNEQCTVVVTGTATESTNSSSNSSVGSGTTFHANTNFAPANINAISAQAPMAQAASSSSLR